MNRKKIVITGASGFLGSNLLNQLKDDRDYDIYALSSKPKELKERIGGQYIHYHNRGYLLNDGGVELFEDAIIINCAYPRNSTGTAIADGLKYIQGVFESAAKNRVASIINISSQSVYSQLRTEVAIETTPICLESPYAVGKYAVELLLESICKKSGTRYTNLRMASLIGPEFDQRIVNRFVKMILNHEPITIVRQNKRFGFLDVQDAVNAICAVLNVSACSWQTIYNVGNGRGYTIEEIYDVAANILKNNVEIEGAMIEIGAETSTTAVSYERIMEDTGFFPKISLEDSIKRIVAQL